MEEKKIMLIEPSGLEKGREIEIKIEWNMIDREAIKR